MSPVPRSSLSQPATLPGALLAAAAAHGDRSALRHKRGGIWQSWSFADHRDAVAATARRLDAAGLGAGDTVAVIGDNRPQFYRTVLAAQALGATVMPVGPEFLRRFGRPDLRVSAALCDGAEAASLWRGSGGPEPLDLPGEEAGGDAAWLAARVALLDPTRPALLLHEDGAEGAPRPVTLSHAALLEAGRAAVAALHLGSRDRSLAFLPTSSIADAAVALVQSPLAGFCVHCVEGPASVPLDLREVAPTYLPAPARVFELIVADARRRLAAGGRIARLLERAGGPLLFAAPLRNALGLSRCRRAFVTAGTLEPGCAASLDSWGVAVDTALRFGPAGEPVQGVAPDLPRRIEALLRGEAGIDRARVVEGPDGLFVRLAAPAGQRPDIAAVVGRLAGEGVRVAEVDSAEDGFAPHELTLEGEVRHGAPALLSPVAAQPPAGAAQAAPAPRRIGPVLMEVRDVQLSFGGVKALSDVSLAIREGEILSIIGPNGAGKTSLLNVINGVYHPRAGTILFAGRERRRMRPALAARSGIGRTFQHVALFKGMNVVDNLLVGRAARFRRSFPAAMLRLPGVVAEERRQRAAVEEILAFLELEHLRTAAVASLPYGIQKRVELGRALAAEPRLLLLDEPMAGMTHEEKRDMCGFIRRVNERYGTTVVIIEHDIGVAMGLSDRVAVLNYGRKIADGPPAAVRADPQVIAAYLGSAAVGDAA